MSNNNSGPTTYEQAQRDAERDRQNNQHANTANWSDPARQTYLNTRYPNGQGNPNS